MTVPFRYINRILQIFIVWWISPLEELCYENIFHFLIHIHLRTNIFVDKIIKSKNRSLTDISLEALVKISKSNLIQNFKKLVEKCERFHLSHWKTCALLVKGHLHKNISNKTFCFPVSFVFAINLDSMALLYKKPSQNGPQFKLNAHTCNSTMLSDKQSELSFSPKTC